MQLLSHSVSVASRSSSAEGFRLETAMGRTGTSRLITIGQRQGPSSVTLMEITDPESVSDQ
jgi:hypothetical protein